MTAPISHGASITRQHLSKLSVNLLAKVAMPRCDRRKYGTKTYKENQLHA